jgi:hypothetical protein
LAEIKKQARRPQNHASVLFIQPTKGNKKTPIVAIFSHKIHGYITESYFPFTPISVLKDQPNRTNAAGASANYNIGYALRTLLPNMKLCFLVLIAKSL